MSLATRCPACRTAFRVLQDQLKVSGGWVRCGRCSEVFSALDGLYDLERDPWAPTSTEATAELGRGFDDPVLPSRSGEVELGASGASVGPMRTDSPYVLSTVTHDSRVALPDSTWAESRGADSSVLRPGEAAIDDDAVDESAAVQTPSFIARADRAARWHKPWVRALLGLIALTLLATGLGQLAIIERDWVAARWPQARAWLEAACEPLACRIEPLRRIERLAVDSSGLVRVEGAPMYRLSVVLRNRAELPLLLPAIELTLNDAQGRLIARRVLRAAEAGATQTTIAAGAELPLQTLLSAGEQRLAGYTIEIFYP
jgi:predicted Zn finger-like uncharacterized protein